MNASKLLILLFLIFGLYTMHNYQYLHKNPSIIFRVTHELRFQWHHVKAKISVSTNVVARSITWYRELFERDGHREKIISICSVKSECENRRISSFQIRHVNGEMGVKVFWQSATSLFRSFLTWCTAILVLRVAFTMLRHRGRLAFLHSPDIFYVDLFAAATESRITRDNYIKQDWSVNRRSSVFLFFFNKILVVFMCDFVENKQLIKQILSICCTLFIHCTIQVLHCTYVMINNSTFANQILNIRIFILCFVFTYFKLNNERNLYMQSVNNIISINFYGQNEF